ncbi:alpha/beta hydrolase [Agrilactobacillus fermenti]|uniref:alpha/beta hydrolase n=1 Tax=Agrilactobacillus fermenti TaxID=2586909 RepID=UPI001E3ED08A|nr:alpha/beta hydrolase [Agrilactobacillus fermenti]MCD2256958.1 alpha/beta hydrolase [Agrilactobacillus fermenti]
MYLLKQSLPTQQETPDHAPAYLQGYVHEPNPEIDRQTYPGIVIIPGGSYTHIPEHQAEILAQAFYAQGYQAFYLRYHFIDEKAPLMPAPLVDVANAMHYLYENSDDLALEANRIVVAGFSVGGQVAALYGDYWAAKWLDEQTGTTADTRKPAALVLGYPVINLKAGFPKEKSDALAIADDLDAYAADEHVNKQNPPTFIWVTNDDQMVPVKNSLLYANALNQHGVPQELHIFDHGPHGLALANAQTAWREGTDLPHVAKWFELAQEWLFNTLTTE